MADEQNRWKQDRWTSTTWLDAFRGHFRGRLRGTFRGSFRGSPWRAENREINPRGSCRGRSRGRSRGRTRGSTRGPTRGATRGPTRGSRLAFACSARRPTKPYPRLHLKTSEKILEIMPLCAIPLDPSAKENGTNAASEKKSAQNKGKEQIRTAKTANSPNTKQATPKQERQI